ncbi:hypothetical protein ACWZHB_12940 [Nocardia sp. FBN12]|uniref:hypothetical protein n=1 Tax=Nocardia sp. FBN12 TaxID=3419766 RepID=UPI003D0901DA
MLGPGADAEIHEFAASWAVRQNGLCELLVSADDFSTERLSGAGWTMAIAAHALRTSGADAVLPFALATPDLTPVPVSRRAIPVSFVAYMQVNRPTMESS